MLKRCCQVNYIRFDHIENFIFGEGYRPEVRITMTALGKKIQELLQISGIQANLFAKYLVREGQQQVAQSHISPNTKVL